MYLNFHFCMKLPLYPSVGTHNPRLYCQSRGHKSQTNMWESEKHK